MIYNCSKATELLDKSITEKLSLLTKIRLKIHRLMCPVCDVYYKQSQKLSFWIKNSKTESVDKISLSEETKQRIIENVKKRNNQL